MTARATKLFTGIVTAAALAVAAPSSAQDESRFSGIFQLDVTNAYFFRGILQEREGILLQPWAELYYSLYSSEDGFLRDVSVGGGIWNSFHSERTGASDTMGWWYETDLYPLISMGFAGGVNLTTYYFFYESPNDAFETAEELNFRLSWDDSDALGAWSLQPWVNVAIETVRTALGPDEGVGVQAGVAPTLYTATNDAFTLTAPLEIGLSINDYYERASGSENAFGYGSVGLAASVPLTFIPESAGSWSLGLAAEYFFFNTTLERVNRGRSTYPVGTLSLGVEF